MIHEIRWNEREQTKPSYEQKKFFVTNLHVNYDRLFLLVDSSIVLENNVSGAKVTRSREFDA